MLQIQTKNLLNQGIIFIIIIASTKNETIVNNFLALISSLKKNNEAVYNILPPSTGPKGNKLNKPIPMLIMNNHNNNSANQEIVFSNGAK